MNTLAAIGQLFGFAVILATGFYTGRKLCEALELSLTTDSGITRSKIMPIRL